MGDKSHDPGRSREEWTRREFLKLAGAGAAYAALGGAGGVSLPRTVLGRAQGVKLKFTRLGYSIDTNQGTIKKIQSAYNSGSNAQLLKDKGVAKPPATWEELADQAKFLRGKGIESPIAFEFAAGLPTTYDNFTAMMFGRGGEWFDKDLNPIFDQPKSAARQQLAWLADVVKQKLATVLPHETDVVKAMNTGRHVYTVLWNYNLADANNKAVHPLAGQQGQGAPARRLGGDFRRVRPRPTRPGDLRRGPGRRSDRRHGPEGEGTARAVQVALAWGGLAGGASQ